MASQERSASSEGPSRATRRARWFIRYAFPALVLAVGLLMIAADADLEPLGVSLVVAAPLVVMVNILVRLGISSDRDRDEEEAARRRFARTHRWDDRGGRPTPHH